MPQIEQSRRPGSPRAGRKPLRLALAANRTKFAGLCLFVGCVFAMGGGSRWDIQSLVVLRPLAFAFIAYAVLVIQPEELRWARWPLALLGALALLAVGQLIPLPPEIWTRLPGRAILAQIGNDAGLPLGYRPLTLSPSRTLNMLLSLGVPLAAILLVAIQDPGARQRIPAVLLIGGGISALVATAQLAGIGGGALYLYRITNADFPVGLFANRNHQALMMAVVIVLIAEVLRRAERDGRQRPIVAVGLLFASLVVIALLLVSGSRAGLVLAGISGAAAVVMVARRARSGSSRSERPPRTLWLAAGGLGVVALVAAMVFFSRAESIDRLWANDAFDDYRVQRLPLLLAMARDHWGVGIGFGAFEGAYRRYETLDALTPFIFNQAHNDWLQFPMEGGIPAFLILAAALGLLVPRARVIVAEAVRGPAGGGFALLVTLALIAVASVVDYPLRTPIFATIAAIAFTLIMGLPRASARR